MSKFYVGATFTRFREVRAIIDTLEAAGHECAEDWTRSQDFDSDGELKSSAGDGYQQADHWPEAANKERDAIREVAEDGGFCIFLGEQPSLGWPVEFGMALAFGVPEIIVVAPFKTTVFVALPEVNVVDTKEDALSVVGAGHVKVDLDV